MKQIFLCLFFFLALFSTTVNAQNTDYYNQNLIKDIRITLPNKNWMITLDSFKVNGNGMLLGKVSVDGKFFDGAGVRYRGNASFKYGDKRNPYYIKLNETQKDATLGNGQTSIILSSALRDPSMLREVLGYEIAGKYMPAPKACYARLYVNEEYVGLYVFVEPIENPFLKRTFGNSENTFIKCSPVDKTKVSDACRKNTFSDLELEDNAACYASNYEILKGNSEDLAQLITTLNKNPQEISKYLDVDKTLWMLAFNNVCANLSSYSGQQSQNYYLYKNNDGRFVPIMWDLNLCFGSFKNTGIGSDLSNEEIEKLDPMLHSDNELKPLIRQLLAIPMYNRMYQSHVKQIVSDNFVNLQALQKKANDLQNLISSSFVMDKNKYYKDADLKKSLTNVVGEKSKIPGLFTFLQKRTDFFKKSSIFTVEAPSVSTVKVAGREKFKNSLVDKFIITARVDNYPKQVTLMYRTPGATQYQEMTMAEESKGKYKATIEPNGNYEKIEYYIVSENAKAMDFYPSVYFSAPMTTSLSVLNK